MTARPPAHAHPGGGTRGGAHRARLYPEKALERALMVVSAMTYPAGFGRMALERAGSPLRWKVAGPDVAG